MDEYLTIFQVWSLSDVPNYQSVWVERNFLKRRKKTKTRGSGCGQPQAGSALNEVLKSNFNDVDYNVSTQSDVTDYFMKKTFLNPDIWKRIIFQALTVFKWGATSCLTGSRGHRGHTLCLMKRTS